MKALVLCAALAAGTAMAQSMVFRQGNLAVRLTQADCQIPGMSEALVGAGGLTEPKQVLITHNATELRGCWSVDKDGDVLIGDESGSTGFLPMVAFKPAPSI
jgi:hypothetical protein